MNRSAVAPPSPRSVLAGAAGLLALLLGLGAGPLLAAGGAHLLLTEIVVTPTEGEYFEIHNPTGAQIPLENVYVTDATTCDDAGGGGFCGDGDLVVDHQYWKIVTGIDHGGTDTNASDFHARFPAGAVIDPGEYQTVALAGSLAFRDEYGFDPTYELFEDEPGRGAGDGIPEMREAVPGSAQAGGGLSNSGEVLVLYEWDGVSDLVIDLDYALWGDKREAVSKTGVLVDSATDGDAVDGAYLDDTSIASQDVILPHPASHPQGSGYSRVRYDEGVEAGSGGNGLGGHDETSEDFSSTWAVLGASVGRPPSVGWVLNEVHVEPDTGMRGGGGGGGFGDANGDGSAHALEDQFLEIVSSSSEHLDLEGWEIRDAARGLVRHTFPAASFLNANCAVVIFGGGSPTGDFGNALVQTSAAGLQLDPAGETLELYDDTNTLRATFTYGANGGAQGSRTLVPDVFSAPPRIDHETAPVSSPGLFSPGTEIDGMPFSGCPPAAPTPRQIWEVQGPGAVSPDLGDWVEVFGEVTAVGSSGFFLQSHPGDADGDPDTSDGIWVETGAAPAVAAGEDALVRGIVEEHFGFTRLGGFPSVSLMRGSPTFEVLPVDFDASTPSPDPESPTCSDGTLECLEGMLVRVQNGTVAGPSQFFTPDPIAEIHAVATGARPFREPGVEYPGVMDIPVFDGNPEVFEVDSDGLGLPTTRISSGQPFSATGGLAYTFGDYVLWPSVLQVGAPPRGGDAVLPAVPVREKTAGEVTIGSLNLFRLLDPARDGVRRDPGAGPELAEGGPDLDLAGPEDAPRGDLPASCKLPKLAAYVVDVMRAPDVLVVQEVETIAVLGDLADEIALADPSVTYTPVLVEGNDGFGLDVAALVRDTVGLVSFQALGGSEQFDCAGDPRTTHDRPPLRLELDVPEVGGRGVTELVVLGVHARSFILSSTFCGPDNFTWIKRLAQAESIAQMVQDHQAVSPDVPLVAIGDFNDFEFSDGFVDVIGQVAGTAVAADNQYSFANLTSPPMEILTARVPEDERYSYTFAGSAQVLDHALVTEPGRVLVSGVEYGRGNADSPRVLEEDGCGGPAAFDPELRSSDHDGLVVFVELPSALIFADGFESGDTSAW